VRQGRFIKEFPSLLVWAVLVCLIPALYFLLAFHPIWDVDIFWHIAAGEWIIDNLSLPSTDIFSAVDSSRPWTTFQWLYEALACLVDRAAGLAGVRAVHAAAIALSLALLARHMLKDAGALFALAAVSIVAVLFADRLRVRPDAFNLLFLVLLLPHLFSRELTRRSIAVVVLLSALWANVHAGGALLAPILLAARLFGRILDLMLGRLREGGGPSPRKVWQEVSRDALALGGSVAALCLMPGFLVGTYTAFSMLGPSERFIPEWMTTWEFLLEHAATVHEVVAALLPLTGMLVMLAVAARSLAGPGFRHTCRDLACAIPLVFLSLLHVRFLWLGAVPWLFLFLQVSKAVPSLPSGPVSLRGRRWTGAAVLCCAIAMFVLDVHYHVYRNDRGPGAVIAKLSNDLEDGEYPEGAADFLRRARVSGRILNHAAWGGYLLYRLWPECKVFTDGRGNFGPLETELLAMLERPSARRNAVEHAYREVRFEVLVHPNPFPLFDADPADWVLVYRDRVGRAYLRNSAENFENLSRVAESYRGLGLDVEWPELPGGAVDFQRKIERFRGERMLARDEEARRLSRLKALPDTDRRATMLAAFYFDLGLYERTRLELEKRVLEVPEFDPNAAFLYALALLADGSPRESLAVCDRISRQMAASSRTGAVLLRGRARALFDYVYAHLRSRTAGQ